MKILFYDVMQEAMAVPDALITPALSDTWKGKGVKIAFGSTRMFDCVGIGNTDATELTLAGQTITMADPSPYPASYKNGLYLIDPDTASSIEISHNGTYVGRIAIGRAHTVGCGPPREPGFWTTNVARETLSGQVIAGAGGVSGRRIDVDFRYKFNRDIFEDVKLAYPGQLSRGFPLFLLFDDESHRMPWDRLYARTDAELLFQSSVNQHLYSRKFKFMECY